MKKFIQILLICIVLLMSFFTGCQKVKEYSTFTDDMGRSVTLQKVPQRLVSHVPSITEMLFAIGLEDRIVGVSDYCDYPPEAKQKPSVGNYFNPSIENIVALQPDLVLTDGHSESIKQLDSMNIPFIVIDPKDINGIIKDIELLGKITGLESRANELVRQMNEEMNTVTSKVGNLSRVRVFYIVDFTDPNNPWTAGPGSFIDWIINTAGGENIASKASGDYVQYSVEQIVSDDPQIIIYPEVHGSSFVDIATLKNHPVWKETTAVKQDMLFAVDADLVSRNGPRITQGLLEVARIIHPEAFK